MDRSGKESKKLIKKARKLKLACEKEEEREQDEPGSNPAFTIYDYYSCIATTSFPVTSSGTATNNVDDESPTKDKRQSKNKPKVNNAVIYSDISCDQEQILCGLANDWIVEFSPETLATSPLTVANSQFRRKHVGLSHLCCSRVSPFLSFSSSSLDGSICQWDSRVIDQSKPVQIFSLSNSKTRNMSGGVKPIISFDVNMSDQLLCGGTEVINEDCYLLFWDIRSPSNANSSQLLGAYWQSHADDVTAVKFHPEKGHFLCSGSTDGLLNIFNLLETTEDDALLYSFNTESSVDSIAWRSSLDDQQNPNHVIAFTHSNEMQIWDAESGDPISTFNREQVAKAMGINDPESVHLNGCHRETRNSIKIVASSTSGDFARVIELQQDNKLYLKNLFNNQTSILQASNYLMKANRWITFDENGFVKLWSPSTDSNYAQDKVSDTDTEQQGPIRKKDTRTTGRFNPYSEKKRK